MSVPGTVPGGGVARTARPGVAARAHVMADGSTWYGHVRRGGGAAGLHARRAAGRASCAAGGRGFMRGGRRTGLHARRAAGSGQRAPSQIKSTMCLLKPKFSAKYFLNCAAYGLL